MSTTVTLLHRCLVEAIHRSRPEMLDRPIVVAEIYQSLVPYRSAREALGVEANADYELALLRLLAGEGDLVQLEPTAARDELRRELRSSNPNLGLFRKFAACDVRVNMTGMHLTSRHDTGAAVAGEDVTQRAVSDPAGAPASPSRPAEPVRQDPARAPERDVASSSTNSGADPVDRSAGAAAAAATSCPFCAIVLPTGRTVRFCYACGEDQSRHPCGECGEVVESEWRFCVACGAAARASRHPGEQHA
jgi:hypothetical protein